MKTSKEEMIKRFRDSFPSFEGVGAPYPIFKDTPNRKHLEQFILNERNKAYDEGFKDGFEDCKGLVERGEHAHCCIKPGGTKKSFDMVFEEIEKAMVHYDEDDEGDNYAGYFIKDEHWKALKDRLTKETEK